ncbi:hypothetical protein ACF06W_27270 [Streptomyces albus]|uniref:hypothetical protein n=1 Tax=Streptomyces albus TaxID=1888 RepID=UPI0036F93F45
MGVYVATIEQDEHGHWTAASDGLTGTGNGYTAARDALTDALFTRDGEEPKLRRDRTEVPIPVRAERTPDRLLALVAAELPDQAAKCGDSLEKARELDARDADALGGDGLVRRDSRAHRHPPRPPDHRGCRVVVRPLDEAGPARWR